MDHCGPSPSLTSRPSSGSLHLLFSKLSFIASNRRGNFFSKVKTSHNLNSGYRSTFECAIKTTISATISSAYFCAISRPIGQSIASIVISLISSPSIPSSTIAPLLASRPRATQVTSQIWISSTAPFSLGTRLSAPFYREIPGVPEQRVLSAFDCRRTEGALSCMFPHASQDLVSCFLKSQDPPWAAESTDVTLSLPRSALGD